MIPICFGGLAIFGFIFLIITILTGDLLDLGSDALDSLDNILEGLGLDLIPDGVPSIHGFGSIIVATYVTFFGATGLFMYLTYANFLLSLVSAILVGTLPTGIVIALAVLLKKQEANSTHTETSLIGETARVTVVGENILEILVQKDHYTGRHKAYSVENEALKRDDRVTIIDIKGNTFYVRKASE